MTVVTRTFRVKVAWRSGDHLVQSSGTHRALDATTAIADVLRELGVEHAAVIRASALDVAEERGAAREFETEGGR